MARSCDFHRSQSWYKKRRFQGEPMPRPVSMAFLLAAALTAQTTNGTIVGSVRDSSDLAVVNAEVRLTQTTTGAIRRSATNERGDFTFTSVVPGEYSVAVSSSGFK